MTAADRQLERLRELAAAAMYGVHRAARYQAGNGHQDLGHTTPEIEDCPHPDCALVRAGGVETPPEQESAERTLKSIAIMLGWGNVPPRETLERDIAALKARGAVETPAQEPGLLDLVLKRFHGWRSRLDTSTFTHADGLAFVREIEALRGARSSPPPAESVPIRHGVNCEKVHHLGMGYLHAADDDRPYDVDGLAYCGRCHVALSAREIFFSPPLATEPRT